MRGYSTIKYNDSNNDKMYACLFAIGHISCDNEDNRWRKYDVNEK